MLAEAISISYYEPKIYKAMEHVFDTTLWEDGAFVLDRTKTVLASRQHAHEKSPLYIKEGTIFDYNTTDWLVDRFLDVLSDTMTDHFEHITHEIVGRNIHLYFLPFETNDLGSMSSNKKDLKINQLIIENWLYDFVHLMLNDLNKKHIIVNRKLASFEQFIKYLKHVTFWDLVRENDNIMNSLQDIMHKLSSTIVHELVHAIQMTKPVDAPYTSYLKKGQVDDDDSDEVYFASPQEIPAFAHQLAIDVIKRAQKAVSEDKLKQRLVDDLRLIVAGNYNHDIITHYFDLFNKPGNAKYLQIYKRFIKLVYNEIMGFIENMKVSEIMKEMADAGATTAANIGTVVNPHISPGPARGKKSYTGSFGKSGTKSPAQPKVVQPKNADGTAKNALDMNSSLFGGAVAKR